MCEKKQSLENSNFKTGSIIGEVSVKLFAGMAESAGTKEPVSYTHLTLPTTPYV